MKLSAKIAIAIFLIACGIVIYWEIKGIENIKTEPIPTPNTVVQLIPSSTPIITCPQGEMPVGNICVRNDANGK